jgi:hypothetical protein
MFPVMPQREARRLRLRAGWFGVRLHCVEAGSGGGGQEETHATGRDACDTVGGEQAGGGCDRGGGHAAPAGGGTGRDSHLHLLLSYAGWQPDPWIERLPRLLEPMGVRSHVAQSGRQASRLIAANPIHVAVVDLGLPLDETVNPARGEEAEWAEGGPRLLELLARLSEPPPVVAVKRSRTHRDDTRDIAAALRLGAFAVVDRPHDAAGLNLMLEVLRRCLEKHYNGGWPRMGGAGG